MIKQKYNAIASQALTLLIATLMLAMQGGSARAAELGAPAAPLDIEFWGKGGPVNMAEGKGKHIYVIDFWATWCAPCIAAVPHLTELARKFRDQGVILISVNSTEEKKDVEGFVKEQGDKVDYIVALDREGKTSKGYMDVYGVETIPHTFVIDKAGNMVWHGNPRNGLEEVLQELVDGTYDVEKVKQREKAEALMPIYQHLLSATAEVDLAHTVFERIVKYAGDDNGLMLMLAFSSLGDQGNDKTHLDLARKAMDRALSASKKPDLKTLAGNARLLKLEGKAEEAAKAEAEANALAKTDEEREMVKQIAGEGL